MKKETDDFDLEELDLEDYGDFEGEPEDEFEDWQEDQKPLKTGTMILVFLGLVILAAILCAILWNFTHRDKEDSGNMGSLAEISQEIGASEDAEISSESTEAESSSEGTTQPPDGDVTEPSSETASEAGQQSAAGQQSEAGQQSAASVEETDTANRVSTMDGRVIVFTDCDDVVSPKEYVNLRLEPSTSEGNATVHCRLNYGETVHRTGISEDSGWSRVEKDGVVCYVVTSYVYVVEETQ